MNSERPWIKKNNGNKGFANQVKHCTRTHTHMTERSDDHIRVILAHFLVPLIYPVLLLQPTIFYLYQMEKGLLLLTLVIDPE